MPHDFEVTDANTMVGPHPFRKLDMTVGKLVRLMDAYRINQSMVMSTIGVFHDHLEGNAATLKATGEGDRLIPVGTINPIRYFGTADDCKAMFDKGFKIFKFHPVEQRWPIDSAAFSEVLRHLSPMGVPVMLEVKYPGDPSRAARVFADYPGPVVLCGVSLDLLSEMLVVMRDTPHLLLEIHSLCVPGAVELAVERVGAERVIFGSGTPRCSAASPLQYVLLSELSDEDKARVLAGNIKRILEPPQ